MCLIVYSYILAPALEAAIAFAISGVKLSLDLQYLSTKQVFVDCPENVSPPSYEEMYTMTT